MSFGVKFTCILDRQFFAIFAGFIFDTFPPVLAPLGDIFDIIAAIFSGILLVIQFERTVPFVLIEIE